MPETLNLHHMCLNALAAAPTDATLQRTAVAAADSLELLSARTVALSQVLGLDELVPELREELARHELPRVRERAVATGHWDTDALVSLLAQETNPEVRVAALGHSGLPPAVVADLAASIDADTAAAVLRQPGVAPRFDALAVRAVLASVSDPDRHSWPTGPTLEHLEVGEVAAAVLADPALPAWAHLLACRSSALRDHDVAPALRAILDAGWVTPVSTMGVYETTVSDLIDAVACRLDLTPATADLVRLLAASAGYPDLSSLDAELEILTAPPPKRGYRRMDRMLRRRELGGAPASLTALWSLLPESDRTRDVAALALRDRLADGDFVRRVGADIEVTDRWLCDVAAGLPEAAGWLFEHPAAFWTFARTLAADAVHLELASASGERRAALLAAFAAQYRADPQGWDPAVAASILEQIDVDEATLAQFPVAVLMRLLGSVHAEAVQRVFLSALRSLHDDDRARHRLRMAAVSKLVDDAHVPLAQATAAAAAAT